MTEQSTTLESRWQQRVNTLPLIAILRGLLPSEASQVGEVLVEAGFRIIEVPLNSPDPFTSIATLAKEFGDQVIIGAGTVLSGEQVIQTIDAGGQLIVAPDLNEQVARQVSVLSQTLSERQGQSSTAAIYCPGIATPSEAFRAIRLGAHGLKLFPAEMITPAIVKSLRAVLPVEASLFPVGSINPDNMSAYLESGANGFGIGSALFKPGKSLEDLRVSARQFTDAYRLATAA